MATIPTSEGGLAWTILGPDEDNWLQAVAELPDGRRVSVFGHPNDKMEGEWMGTVHHKDGAHGNYGYAPGTSHLRKALRYFAEKVTGLALVRED